MPTTFLEICNQLAEDAGISGALTSVTAQSGEHLRVVNWVKRATTELEGAWFNWDFLHTFYSFNTIVGVADYPPPADMNLWDTTTFKVTADGSNLDYTMWTRMKTDASLPVDGDVYRFTVLPRKTLRLYSTPSTTQALSMEYWKQPTVLVANTDEPLIPVQFRDVIVAKALQYYANYESAEEVKMQAQETLMARMRQLESHSLPAHQASGSVNNGVDIQVSAGGEFGYDY